MQRLLLEDFLGVAGDHQLLVGSDDQSADLCAPGGDVADIAHGMLVLLGIDACKDVPGQCSGGWKII